MGKKIAVTALNTLVMLGVSALTLVGCTNNNMLDQQTSAQNTAAGPAIPAAPLKMIGTNKDATLSALNIDNRGGEIVSKPSEKINVTVNYAYNCSKCNQGANNQIIVGLAGRSAQACIYDGGNTGQGSANFVLKTPAMPGTYEVRFHTAQAANCQDAIQNWWSVGGAPSQSSTIGKITVVKLKS